MSIYLRKYSEMSFSPRKFYSIYSICCFDLLLDYLGRESPSRPKETDLIIRFLIFIITIILFFL